MSKENINNRFVFIVVILVVIILIPFVYSIVKSIFMPGIPESGLFLERPDEKYENCIRETEYMRYHHWELLREVREEVVRYGKRGDISLDRCRECHTSKERFCNKCHDAVSLVPDCFGCHYYPEPDGTVSNKSHTNTEQTSPDEIIAGSD
jgi:[DsrC]-trisulfide reductase subunit J